MKRHLQLLIVSLVGLWVGLPVRAQIVAPAPLPMVAPPPSPTPLPVSCASVHKITLNDIFSEDGTLLNSYWLFWTGAVLPDGVHYHVGDYRLVNKGIVGGGGIAASFSYDSVTKLYKLEWQEGSIKWCVTSPRSEQISSFYDIEVRDRTSEPAVPRVKLPNPTVPAAQVATISPAPTATPTSAPTSFVSVQSESTTSPQSIIDADVDILTEEAIELLETLTPTSATPVPTPASYLNPADAVDIFFTALIPSPAPISTSTYSW